MGFAVVIALAVGVVVLLVVRHQVAQREIVGGGHKVDGRKERTAAAVLWESAEPVMQDANSPKVAGSPRQVTHGVAVPFHSGPLRRKLPTW